jgi:ElaB/YqjD/DUF883 family membrane-anchored ribosome-binding protein
MARTSSNSNSRNETQSRARRAKADARESVEDLKTEMSDFKSRLENLAASGTAEGAATVRDLFSRMQTRFDDFFATDFADQLGVNAAMDKGREKVEDMRVRVQENPVQSVIIAAGVGALIGFLMRR